MKFNCKTWPGASQNAFPDEHYHWAPIVNLRLIHKHSPPTKWIEAIADTGAHCCMFHASFCHALGIDLKNGIEGNLGGIIGGANIPVYFHPVKILIGSTQVQTMAGFSENFPSRLCWVDAASLTITHLTWTEPQIPQHLKLKRPTALSSEPSFRRCPC